MRAKNPTPRRSSSMDVVLTPSTMNTKIQTQKKKWCPGSRIQVCDMRNVSLSQLLKNLYSDPTMKIRQKTSNRNNCNKKNIKYDRKISNMIRKSD